MLRTSPHSQKGAFYCGYDARDPSQLIGRHYTPTHSAESVKLEQYLERRYMSSMAIFFFASGAALYYSLKGVRAQDFWRKLISRNKYLLLLLLFGMATCVVPVNMIWHGARTVHDAIFLVNPFYHLGFIITLAMFTLMVTPLCWGIVRESVYGWLFWFAEILLLFAVYLVLRSTPLALSSEVCVMVTLNTINLAWMLVSSYYVGLREYRAPVATMLHIATFAVPEHFGDVWHMREAKASNGITTMYLVLLLYLVCTSLHAMFHIELLLLEGVRSSDGCQCVPRAAALFGVHLSLLALHLGSALPEKCP